jgi:glycosyltransferase involved in cell wall biosynthesis
MRILWLSNKNLSVNETGRTGTWLDAMAAKLMASGQVELINLSIGAVKSSRRIDYDGIQQWTIPVASLCSNGLPPRPIVEEIIKIEREAAPDIIHVWGTEIYSGLLTARRLLNTPAILEIQGLKEPYARSYLGGLNSRDQWACIGLKECIKLRNMRSNQRDFAKWSPFEREIIAGHNFICTQTTWVDAWVRACNTAAQLFHTDLMLRAPFYETTSWQGARNPIIFCSAAYPVPYKGVHDAIRAAVLLRRKYPSIKLRIGGALQSKGVRQDGYMAWINTMVCQLNLTNNIEWLGPLTASDIVKELQASSAMLIPAHIENCCTAMQEAMIVGTPVVASCVGGLPSVARDEESVLFFSPGDEVMCAYQLDRVISDNTLAVKLSQNARVLALVRNDPGTIIQRQLSIYRHIKEKATVHGGGSNI